MKRWQAAAVLSVISLAAGAEAQALTCITEQQTICQKGGRCEQNFEPKPTFDGYTSVYIFDFNDTTHVARVKLCTGPKMTCMSPPLNYAYDGEYKNREKQLIMRDVYSGDVFFISKDRTKFMRVSLSMLEDPMGYFASGRCSN